MCLCYCTRKKKVSSANIIGTSKFEELGRSFTYNKNNNGPSIEPCGTAHLISFCLYQPIQEFVYTVSRIVF